MKIEIIQWNISYSCKADKISEFLKSQITSNSVVCLQEVLQSSMKTITENLKPSDYRFSLDSRQPGKFDAKNRKLGVLTMTFGGKITNSHLIDRSVFPERTLVAEVKFSDLQIKVLNFHSLTGVGYKAGKSSNFATIAEYLNENDIDFFCCDANEPRTDSFDIEKLEFWDNGDKGKYPSLIFGKNKAHNLNDSLYSIKEGFQELPVSYKTGPTFRRYDFIFNSENWIVDSLDYLYDLSRKATSDHALVIGKYIKNSAH